MSSWTALQAELDAWGEAGLAATFWWRDDDAAATTPALEALLERAERFQVPLCVAVIPAVIDAGLAARLAAAPLVSVVQHGYAHKNWAALGAKKAELAESRPVPDMAAELADGFASLATAFATQSRPILVPPWNRIAAALVPHLLPLGFRGLSAYGVHRLPDLPQGLRQANTHVDPIDWRGSRGFVGEAAALTLLLGHLQARRGSPAPAAEPIGLLSHHAVEDAAGRHFAEGLFAATLAHPAACWLGVDQIFPGP